MHAHICLLCIVQAEISKLKTLQAEFLSADILNCFRVQHIEIIFYVAVIFFQNEKQDTRIGSECFQLTSGQVQSLYNVKNDPASPSFEN